ncbi:UDP-N-acetylmuramoylalanine--D-glutamate ligase [Candidatus Promineifilum breve]|uniref:UDP-N-acetylmuramoylalanine--D-glutamate ligase n=2 Tax=Candidatus Promineifilum breve TaxID=1806508 RepID=A0A160T2P3_9CHLR|nr:UDP-N-acetylmuramoylalanine--D-glutamate ligase [Candidatus Promineifilum breve]
MIFMDALHGKRLVILGMARQGTALARFAVGVGAFVTLSDMRPAVKLAGARQALADLPADRLRFVLGEHPLSLLDACDVLALSGGVPSDSPLVAEARRRGIPLTNDSLEFMRRAPAPVMGITGSAGKTTTTALVGQMGQKSARQTWIGGNIGRPPLEDLAHMSSNDLIVVELSSFQLELWDECSPPIAAVLNLTPNHLDRHRTMAAYAEAKSHILRHQKPGDVAVLPADDPGALEMRGLARGRLRLFSAHEPVSDGAFVQDGQIWLSDARGQTALCPVAASRLRGRHNVLNVLAAVTLADAAGVPHEAIVEGIRLFDGVPHRLETVRRVGGVQYVNDSIATAPERALAALAAFEEPIILLAGGRDKDMVWDGWARQVAQRVKHVVLFGELGPALGQRLGDRAPTTTVETLAEAVSVAHEQAGTGDVVLLSPGGTSFDGYSDFVERGEHFRLLVRELDGSEEADR